MSGSDDGHNLLGLNDYCPSSIGIPVYPSASSLWSSSIFLCQVPLALALQNPGST